MMKKRLMALLIALMCMLSAAAIAEGYVPGDKVEDFTATLSDGSVFTLSEVLKEKKAVLLNFWASWCGPCKNEMPAMEDAYQQVADDVAFICLSVEPTDTNDNIAELREQLGLETLPMGIDENGLYAKFNNASGGIPFTVVIDKNGVLCFAHSGSEPNAGKFVRMMDVYRAADYDQPVLLDSMPGETPNIAAPDAEEIHKAIGAEGMEVELADINAYWPFIAGEDGVYASNCNVPDSTAAFSVKVDAKAGEGVAFEYAVKNVPLLQNLNISVDGKLVDAVADNTGSWKNHIVSFDTDGEHTVTFTFAYTRKYTDETGDPEIAIRNVRKASAQDVEAFRAKQNEGVKTLEGNAIKLEVVEGDAKAARLLVGDFLINETKVMLGDSMKLRIRVGQDVNIHHVVVEVTGDVKMLDMLPHDDQGYLVELKATGSETHSGLSVDVYESLMTPLDQLKSIASESFMTSEQGMNEQAEYYNEAFAETAEEGSEPLSVYWAYVDDAETAAEEADEGDMNDDGTANYTITVTDKAGNGLENAMVQVCTTETCTMHKTDADGKVTFTGEPYAYEVHILKAPDGYAKPADTYLLPANGGSLTVELDAQ